MRLCLVAFASAVLALIQLPCFSQVKGSDCEKQVNKGMELYKQQKFKEALPFFEAATRICSSDTTMNDYDYYTVLALTSICYYETGREDSALITGEGAAKYFEKQKSYDDPVYNALLGRLGLSYVNYEEYSNAINAFERCIPFYEKKYGISDIRYLNFSLHLARCYSAKSQFSKAALLNRKLCNIIVSTVGKNTTEYIDVVTNIGNDFAALGRYDSAKIYEEESLVAREKMFGKNHLQYAKGLGNIAVVYERQQKFVDAVLLYEQAKSIYENLGSNKSTEYTILLTSLGDCYCSIGQYERGLDMLLKAVEIIRKNYGPYNLKFVSAVHKVANVMAKSKNEYNLNSAIGFCRYSISIMQKIKADSTFQFVTLLSGLGNAYSNTPKKDSAEYFFKKAISLSETLGLQRTENHAIIISNFAQFYTDIKRFEEAEKYYKISLNITSDLYGNDNPNLSALLGNIGMNYYAKGDFKQADSLFKTTFELEKNYILNNTEGLTEEEKESFAINIKGYSSLAVELRSSKKLAASNEWLLNSLLFYKGLLLEGSKGLSRSLKMLQDDELKKKADEYLKLKSYAGVQLLKPIESRDPELQNIQNKITDLERELLKNSSEFRNWKAQFNISSAQIQGKLSSNEAAIEFISYYSLENGFFNKENTKYAAIIQRKNNYPSMVYLFSDEDLKKIIRKGSSSEDIVKKLYRSTIKASSAQPVPSDSLYHLLWKPLISYLNGVNTIYFSADGILNNLNLAAIITPQGKRLIEDYAFIQLSSTRNLVKSSADHAVKEIQLWGGINYNGLTTTSAERSGSFAYLPGTLNEVNDIASAASKNKIISETIVASDANEASFKNLNGRSPEVLHIATHGFFFPDPEKDTTTEDNRFAKASNPLLRSGLALADANTNWKAASSANKEDGILTAYEIADMDLSKTKLVVLSACETGLGDIKSGEGVYGLQRSFKLAGVNSVIMSLWQVPDLETKEFMQTFYANCFAGMPIRKAFRETQLVMNKKYQPYQWAAFVLVE